MSTQTYYREVFQEITDGKKGKKFTVKVYKNTYCVEAKPPSILLQAWLFIPSWFRRQKMNKAIRNFCKN